MRKRIEVSFYKEPFQTSSGRRTKPFPSLMQKRKWNITLNLSKKRREVTRSPRTLNLVRKKVKVLVRQKILNLVRKRKGTSSLNYFESQAEENSSCKFIKDFKPRAEEGQNVRYYLRHYRTFRMNQVPYL